MVQEQSFGAQVRSRAKWAEEGERSTKYFFNLEKQNASLNTIKQLKKADGSYTTSETEILEEEYNYYKNLYKSDNISEIDVNKYLNDTVGLQTLNQKEKDILEGKISECECVEAIKYMKVNKSPGSDGIPIEFYEIFWEDLKCLLIESLNAAYQNEKLSPSQRRGVLTLLYKKGEKALLKNWRPISLLNTDYKILTHILANRLKKVINKLINTDQTGYLKGRSIGYNIRLINDVIDYFENNNIEGAIIFLDFQNLLTP